MKKAKDKTWKNKNLQVLQTGKILAERGLKEHIMSIKPVSKIVKGNVKINPNFYQQNELK